MRFVAAVVALIACLHAGLWALLQSKGTAPNIGEPLASVSYAPFEGISTSDDVPTAAQIRADLKAIAAYTRTIRLYRSTGGMEIVPRIAAEFGLRVTLGIWLDTNLDRDGNYALARDANNKPIPDLDRNEAEIRSAIQLARTYHNITAIVVGNETTLRRSLFEGSLANAAYKKSSPTEFKTALTKIQAQTKAELEADAAKFKRSVEDLKAERNVEELRKVIQRVKQQANVPVTTGETWDIWRDYPKLASSVDFIGAHILPYWDHQPYKEAVDHTVRTYYELRRLHPGKRIVIAEFGWPSAGYNYGASEPGRLEQAMVLRYFVARADALGIDYNVIEAFDQPWKISEGSVGRYWGMLDAARQPKFSWVGPIDRADYWKIAGIAIAVGFLLSLPILTIAGATFTQLLLLGAAAHVIGAWAATVFDYWNGHYFVTGAALALILGLLLLVPLVLIAFARIEEIASVLFGRAPMRLLPSPAPAPDYAPKVSIHVPACMESPEMLKQTLDAVSRLDYANYECVVVINNTPDPAYWRPVEDHCAALGTRFKFVYAETLPGYKAGALRLALAHTAPDAEIIGVIDADYTVRPDWLKDLVPVFADPKVGLIQAPQDHRDEKSPLHWAMNGEYAGFFDIGMVQRNEANAIIVHGTMCLIRRAALDAAGGWSSDTICEDTDLGLSIIELGWIAHYTNRRYGYGLLPDTFEAYKKQRHRWAYRGLQIIRKHWRGFLPGTSRLTSDQKREFALGWLNWLGAESIGVLVALLNLVWVPVVAFAGIAIPDKVLTLPIIAAFAVSLLHFVALYHRRVAISPAKSAAAMLAAMAMQWTVARAVGYGLVKEHLPFVRTAKGGTAKKRVTFPAFYEALIGTLLIAGAVTVMARNRESVREIDIFAYVLLVQSLPFLAATVLAAFEDTRANSFALWQGAQGRVAALLGEPRRAVISPPAAQPAENRIETVQ